MAEYHAICDEGYSDNNNRYLVLGGVFLTSEMVSEIGSRISKWRQAESFPDHTFHFTKVTPRNCLRYKRFVNGIVRNCQQRRMRYRSLVVDKSRIDLRRYHDGDRERGFYSFAHTFLFNCFVKHLCSDDRLHLFWHHRHTRFDLEDLRRRLNSRYMLHSRVRASPVASVQHAPADGNDFVQAADVLTGIIGCDINEKADPTSRRGAAKYDLVKHLLIRSRLDTFKENRSMWSNHFSTWHFDFDAVTQQKNAPQPSGIAAI